MFSKKVCKGFTVFSSSLLWIWILVIPKASSSPQGYQENYFPQSKVVDLSGDQLQNVAVEENEIPNYDFKYQIHGGGNFFGHQETRREYQTQGQYHVLLPDGRRQVVSYYVDDKGYHPTITYEVVGVEPVSNSIDSNKRVAPYPNNNNDGYRSKRSRSYKHSKRVTLKHPVIFKSF